MDERVHIMTLDLATSIGFTRWSPGAKPTLGTHRLPSTDMDVGWFVDAYNEFLKDQFAIERPSHVVYEAPILPGNTQPATALKLMNLAGHTEWVCRRMRINCTQLRIGTWRKHFMGKGGGKRAEMKQMCMDECRARGFEPRNDDEADAFGMLDYAAFCFGFAPDWKDRGLLGMMK